MLSIISTCLSDYFQGSTKPTLAVPVYHSMTAEEFVNSLMTEYQHHEDFPETKNEEFLTLQNMLLDNPFSDLDPSTDEGEGEIVYAYVVKH